jgi:hypothetical protein
MVPVSCATAEEWSISWNLPNFILGSNRMPAKLRRPRDFKCDSVMYKILRYNLDMSFYYFLNFRECHNKVEISSFRRNIYSIMDVWIHSRKYAAVLKNTVDGKLCPRPTNLWNTS